MGTFSVRSSRLTLAVASSLVVAACGSAEACEWFRRGDTDANELVELTDGVATLNFLFLGGPAPPCTDAADADDSGDLGLVDAVATFNFLFLGGAALPPPGPFECGPDPTEDRLFCFDGCEPPPTPLALADFEVFTYEQHPALGFCPPLERVFSAVVTLEDDGLYRIELSFLEPADPETSECLPVLGDDCLVAAPLEPRVVDAAELAPLLDLFAAVPLYPDPAPICDCVAIDPCVIPALTWDGVRGSGFECSSPRLPHDFVTAVLDELEGLRPASP